MVALGAAVALLAGTIWIDRSPPGHRVSGPAVAPAADQASAGGAGTPSASAAAGGAAAAPAATPAGQGQGGELTPALRTVLDERFGSDGGHGWPNDPDLTAWLASDGTYHLYARQPGRFVALGAPLDGPFRDVVVTAGFHKVGGPPGGGYGVIVRDEGPGPRDGLNQAGRYYVFEVGDRGELGIWRRNGDQWDELLPWTESDAVLPGGAPNEITVRAIGPDLTFVVNGTEVATAIEVGAAAGGVGVFVGGDFNEVVLDRVAVAAGQNTVLGQATPTGRG